MSYEFLDLGELSCAEIVRQHSSLLIGRVAVNTSFDSGTIFQPEWNTVNGLCVTPPITAALVDSWPVSHDDSWDEWWIFEGQVPQDFKVTAFCNYCLPIAKYKELDFEGGCPLDHYLDRFRPVAVIGNHQFSAYLIRASAGKGSA